MHRTQAGCRSGESAAIRGHGLAFRLTRRARVLSLVIGSGLLIMSCTTSTGPRGSPKLSVSGAGQADTIFAVLPQLLTVRLANGPQLAAVQFSSVPVVDSGPQFGQAQATIGPPGAMSFGTQVIDTLTPMISASVAVRLGPAAGPARIVVQVPSINLTDTVVFTVTPGASVAVTIEPRDTVIYLTGTARMRPAAIDREGNPTSMPVSFVVDSGPAHLGGAASTILTPSAYGVALLHVKAGAYSDTTSVVIAPAGTLAAALGGNGGPISMFNIDGSGLRLLTNTTGIELRWAPSGGSVIFTVPSEVQHLVSVDTGGVTRVLDTAQIDSGITAATPVYSAHGDSIYYTREVGAVYWLYSLRADGSGSPHGLLNSSSYDIWPAPSPDGTQLAFSNNSDSLRLRVLTFKTGSVLIPRLVAASPVWSPAGNVIGFVQGNDSWPNVAPVATVRPDGTGLHVLTGWNYLWGIDWSPDGQWIVAANGRTNLLDLINATTGQTIPLPFTTDYTNPTWRPVPPAGANVRRSRSARTTRARRSLQH